MKIRKLWLPTLIIGIIGGAALICDTIFNLSGSGFFLSSGVCGGIFIISLILSMIIAFGVSIAERNTDIKAVPGKNVPAALFGFVASVSLIGSGVVNLLSLGASDSLAVTLIMCVLSLAGGIVMLYETCISYTGHNGMSKRKLLPLVTVFWALGRLVTMFMNYQHVSLYAAVKYDVFVVSLLLFFLYYQSLFLTETNPSLSVRRMSVYGIPLVVFGIIVCADMLLKMFMPHNAVEGVDSIVIEPTVSRILSCVGDIAFAGYAAFFIGGVNRSAVFTEEEFEDDEDTEFLEELSGAKERRLKEEALAAEREKEEKEKAERERAAREAAEKLHTEAPENPEEEKEKFTLSILRTDAVIPEEEPENVAEEKADEAVEEIADTQPVSAEADISDTDENEPEDVPAEKESYQISAEEPETEAQSETEASYAPEKAEPAASEKPQPSPDKKPAKAIEDDFDDELFEDPDEEDYAEIFRMLDEMSDE